MKKIISQIGNAVWFVKELILTFPLAALCVFAIVAGLFACEAIADRDEARFKERVEAVRNDSPADAPRYAFVSEGFVIEENLVNAGGFTYVNESVTVHETISLKSGVHRFQVTYLDGRPDEFYPSGGILPQEKISNPVPAGVGVDDEPEPET